MVLILLMIGWEIDIKKKTMIFWVISLTAKIKVKVLENLKHIGLLRKKNTKGVILKQKGTMMAEDGEDWNGLEMTILKSWANCFKIRERWRSSFEPLEIHRIFCIWPFRAIHKPFTLDTCRKVRPPTVDRPSEALYKAYIHAGKNGRFWPSPVSIEVYRKYVSKNYQ